MSVSIGCLLAALTLLIAGAVQSDAQAAISHIWAVDDGEKVFQDDLSHPLKSGGGDNSVWDGSTVQLFAARNEIVAFQLIIEAGAGGALDVNVVVSDLANGGSTISGSHPLPSPNEYVGLGVELFTEHYLDVTDPSYNDPGWGGFYTTYEANPLITGLIPDALIPFSAASGKGGAPFDIAANLNQGVWCDIYVDQGLPSGLYTGTIEVTVGGYLEAAIPLELEVLDLTLPDVNHYRSMVFVSDYCIRPRHDLSWGTDLTEMVLDYHRMAHRHRIELIGSGSWDELMNLEGTITGDAFTLAEGYEGPGEGVGNTLFSVHTYGWSFGDTESEYRTNSDMWVNWFDLNAPDVEYFLYLIDEPGSSMYSWIVERAGWIHNNPGPGSRLPVFVTKWPVSQLIGSVDIWSMQAPWWDPAEIAAAIARGEKAWPYAGNRPQTPMDVIDEYGVALRLKPWIAYKCDVPRWFTWESTHWEPNSNEVPNDVSKNVFVDPVTFYAGYPGSRGNGDGTMFYPGEDYVYPAQNREYAGPMSSIRMKMYRRGIQDYEYMWLAEDAGHGQEVAWILDGVLPDVMWEAPEIPTWSNSNATYEEARRLFVDLLGPPRAPLADFSASATTGCAPLAVDFTDQTIFGPTSWTWDFGDGGTSTTQNPSHAYGNTGSFTVSLTASNAEGDDSETKADYITVVPPVTEAVTYADTWGTYGGWAEVTILEGDLDALAYDDEVYMVAQCDTSNQQYSMWYRCDTPYTPAQVRKITIEYQAKASLSDTPDCLIFVRKSDGSFEHIATRLWSTSDEWYMWETTNIAKYMSADGMLGFEICGCPQNGSNYTISADVLRFRVEVYEPPVAEFSALPVTGRAPLTVQFTDESLYPTAWDWDFGDGGSSTQRNPSHAYGSSGAYTVSLRAINGGGEDTETKTDYITLTGEAGLPLEVHPNERAPGPGGGPEIGTAPWQPSGLGPGSWYRWKVYQFEGGGNLWIQVCAQSFSSSQNAVGQADRLEMRVDGTSPMDAWAIMSGASPYQWDGDVDAGTRLELAFQPPGLTAGLHTIEFWADETPVLWWVKVSELTTPG
jgi:PKD repeat protein